MKPRFWLFPTLKPQVEDILLNVVEVIKEESPMGAGVEAKATDYVLIVE
jgi:hypothetical protein